MEKIIIVHLVGVNAVTGIAPGDPAQVGTNDFKNINIIETLYPSHNYTKAYISIESFSGRIKNETDSIMVYTSGLNDIFVYTNGTQSKCENTNLIEIINSDVLGTVFSYKSNSDRWREISFNSLNNFNLRIVKSDTCLFINLMYTIKFKLVE